MDRRCETCLFWSPDDYGGAAEGECRRHAPRSRLVALSVTEELEDLTPLWPTTFAHEWCGEWAHRPVRQEGEVRP